MRAQFIDEPIDVELAERVPGKPPAAVTWRGETLPVERVEAMWHDASWGPLQARPKRWWQRRHRTYYQVKVPGPRIFELYHDRGLEAWILYRILDLEPEPP
jgi:hypothetical protein